MHLILCTDVMKDLMWANKDWIQDQTKFKTDESKRVQQKGYADIFGMEGSFRQLEFD